MSNEAAIGARISAAFAARQGATNTVEQRRISYQLVQAWQAVEDNNDVDDRDARNMESAMDAIIAAFTPGYNAETDPDYPEETGPDGQQTAAAMADVVDVFEYDISGGASSYNRSSYDRIRAPERIIQPLAIDDEVEPRCDICGRAEDDSPAGFADADWNGETGNHETCERAIAMGQLPFGVTSVD